MPATELKTAAGALINLGWTRPAVPPASKASEIVPLLGNNAQLKTGAAWQETFLKSFFDRIESDVLGVVHSCGAAKGMRINKELVPDVATTRLVESRRAALGSVEGLLASCGAEVEKQFAAVDAFEQIILDVSAPAPVTGNAELARRVEMGALLPSLVGKIDGNLKNLRELVVKALDAGRFEVVEALERATLFMFDQPFDFASVRREWALGRHPDLGRILSDRQSVAEFAYEVCGAVAGHARLAANQAATHGLIGLEDLPRTTLAKVKALADFQPHEAFGKYNSRLTGLLKKEAHGAALAAVNKAQE